MIGIVGAMLGGWIARGMGLYTSSSVGTFLVAIAGAVILVGLTRLIVRHAEKWAVGCVEKPFGKK